MCADKQNSTIEKEKKKKRPRKKTWNARDSSKQNVSKQTIGQKENTKRNF